VASSLLVVADGKVIAPPLDTVLDGITRRAVLEAATFLDFPTEVRPVRWSEVTGADELFMSSTTTAVAPVGSLDDTVYSAPGPISRKLAETIASVQTGGHELSSGWLTVLKS